MQALIPGWSRFYSRDMTWRVGQGNGTRVFEQNVLVPDDIFFFFSGRAVGSPSLERFNASEADQSHKTAAVAHFCRTIVAILHRNRH